MHFAVKMFVVGVVWSH